MECARLDWRGEVGNMMMTCNRQVDIDGELGNGMGKYVLFTITAHIQFEAIIGC